MKRWRWASVNDAGRVVGRDHHLAKLDDEIIDLIFELRAAGLSVRAIAAKFDTHPTVSRTHVCDVLNGRRRAHTVVGQKRVRVDPRRLPADPMEFDIEE